MIHEVKVYDSSGKLKKVISQKTLHKRSDKLFQNPTLLSKPMRGRKKQVPTVELKSLSACEMAKHLPESRVNVRTAILVQHSDSRTVAVLRSESVRHECCRRQEKNRTRRHHAGTPRTQPTNATEWCKPR